MGPSVSFEFLDLNIPTQFTCIPKHDILWTTFFYKNLTPEQIYKKYYSISKRYHSWKQQNLPSEAIINPEPIPMKLPMREEPEKEKQSFNKISIRIPDLLEDPEKLYCVCKRPYGEGEQMMGLIKTSNFFWIFFLQNARSAWNGSISTASGSQGLWRRLKTSILCVRIAPPRKNQRKSIPNRNLPKKAEKNCRSKLRCQIRKKPRSTKWEVLYRKKKKWISLKACQSARERGNIQIPRRKSAVPPHGRKSRKAGRRKKAKRKKRRSKQRKPQPRKLETPLRRRSRGKARGRFRKA